MSTLENLPSFEGIGTGVSDTMAGSAEVCLLSARLGPCVTAPRWARVGAEHQHLSSQPLLPVLLAASLPLGLGLSM